MAKIESFEELDIWKEAVKIAGRIIKSHQKEKWRKTLELRIN